MKNRFPPLLLTCMVVFLLVGCSDDNNSTSVTSKTIGSGGGEIELDHAKLVIPQGALSVDTVITMAYSFNHPTHDRLIPETVIQIGPDGTQFAVPATLILSYNEADLPEGAFEANLKKGTVSDDDWTVIHGSSVNHIEDCVSTEINHLSTYGVLHGTQSIRTVCYDPRWSGDPGSSASTIPSVSELSEDLATVKKYFGAIATYKVLRQADVPDATEDGVLIKLAAQVGLKISVGLYAQNGDVADWNGQVDIIHDRIQDGTIKADQIIDVTVGNEWRTIQTPCIAVSEIVQVMDYARKRLDEAGATSVPVTTRMVRGAFDSHTTTSCGGLSQSEGEQIIDACYKNRGSSNGYIQLTIYPYLDLSGYPQGRCQTGITAYQLTCDTACGSPVNPQTDAAQTCYACDQGRDAEGSCSGGPLSILENFTGLLPDPAKSDFQIVLGETGWPSQGVSPACALSMKTAWTDTNDWFARINPYNQSSLNAPAFIRNVAWFMWRDCPYKRGVTGQELDAYWGLMSTGINASDGQLKFPIQ
jgi:exo-beta-1,3-glucanase (GH17 family)